MKAAISAVEAASWRVSAVSRLYRTPAFPVGAGPDYVNAAIAIETDSRRDARALLADLHSIEAEFGRARVERWGSRTLDLDLLAWGQVIAPDVATFDRWMSLPPESQTSAAPDELILPHPRIQDRSFVLVPLSDVAAGWVHPVLGLSVAEMLDRRPADEKAQIVALT